MLILILGLIVFLGVHTVRIAAPGWRETRMFAIGEGPWKGAYSLASAVGLVLIVWGFAMAWPAAPVLYEPPLWLKRVAMGLMAVSFIVLAAYALPAGRIKAAVKHPMLVGVIVWAGAHLLANGDLAALFLFGAFLVWAVADRVSVARRGDAGPAAGLLWWDAVAVVAGLAVYVLFVWKLHLWLFGVAPPA